MMDNNTSKVKAIGGYFSFEDHRLAHYHTGAIRLNTAKNCLEYILRLRNYQHVYIPYFTCDVVKTPFEKLGIRYTEYSINEDLEPQDLPDLRDDEAFLYTNYFGIKSSYVNNLSKRFGKNLIVDNAQAFFEQPIEGVDTFYSARKFLGVSDGAYLYVDSNLKETFPKDISYERLTHLFKRIDLTPEAAYDDFNKIENSLFYEPIKQMSNVTEIILNGIDYNIVKERRKKNFIYLHAHLQDFNKIRIDLKANMVPMVYPYLSSDPELKRKLIQQSIFIPTYWPNILEHCDKSSKEYELATHLVAIPIDQRYDDKDMERIINTIKSFNNEKG